MLVVVVLMQQQQSVLLVLVQNGACAKEVNNECALSVVLYIAKWM